MPKMMIDHWMSDFYGTTWYKVDPGSTYNEPGMYESIVDSKDYDGINKLILSGFQLVETAVEFVTLIDNFEDPIYKIRKARQSDYNQISELITLNYRDNINFYNRFKNRSFFTQAQTESYFQSTFKNYVDSSITMVYEDSLGISSFYMLKLIPSNVLTYKGILCGNSKRVKGMNMHIEMQKACAKLIGSPYKVINRTQMSNYKIVNNHIKSNRRLSKVEHYFYKLLR